MDVAKKIIAGERLQPDDNLEFLLSAPLEELQKGAAPNSKQYTLANILIAVPITYAGGLVSMILVLKIDLAQALTMAVLPFIPGDVLKATAAAFVGVKLQRILERR